MSRRALISVYEKAGVGAFARALHELDFELVSSGGTAAFLEEQGLPVTRVEDVTHAPEMLGGRVKTLHPRIHAGILARRELAEDVATLEAHEIEPFDLVCVNLYPFAAAAGRRGATEAEVVEMIDVGGPSMLRAAAKNFPHVAAVSHEDQYDLVLAELREHGEVTLDTRRQLAQEAFQTTAVYEATIANWFGELQKFPDQLTLPFRKVTELSYGENPHQAAAYYAEIGARRHLLSRVEQLGGKELSYNNLADLEGARRVLREFALPAFVIVKHANPCGAAVAGTIEEAWERALAADPVSAFGCVAIANREIPEELGARIAEHFVEVLMAPGYEDGAVEALRTKKALRILVDRERRAETPGERDYKRVLGGLLVQERDADIEDRATMEVATGSVTEQQWGDLLFAWRVCKHVSSNAIVLARDLQTIGVGAGQMSRVDAVRIAVEKAREHGHDLQGAVLASDAFFPFADGPQIALDAGVNAIIQPGGSRRDTEVLDAVAAAGAAMVVTGRRHFRH
ncbi:MAG TPA: bifunctional phosphoribosylaminoimidazolecarboxamide formyltransferase/IMP cyclohydrolase [Gaiellaceae bacterium]|jgi:phosphoribosylaminoimidazolecarboxamide formyltransferase/IMP cyclohydrolase|nr:bifunctional phosphoribosylaminoimidazolecarboxamide formyltransferase/IMP cyclohydrolase [Gaiellaceae bacterium]